ncbi:MAG: protein YgfX [Enterobacteriaceae bacterium]|nr:protein YgfX [Enterobacteriaceae bacterium]
MALWHNKLTISRQVRLFSSGVHGVFALVIISVPWFESGFYFRFAMLPMLVIIMLSWKQSQKRIKQCQGELALFSDNTVRWQNKKWSITESPWLSRYGVMISLRTVNSKAFNQKELDQEKLDQKMSGQTGKTYHQPKSTVRLWVASDSMPPAEWRSFNQLVRQYPDI